MFFVGSFELSIDGKHRLSIPYAIREKLNAGKDGTSHYVMPGRRPGTLLIYPDKYFESVNADAPSPDDLSEQTYEFFQFQCAHTAWVVPDNQGRILIPEPLLKLAGIGKEAMLIGVHDHMELWDRKAFETFGHQKWQDYPQHRAKAIKELKEQAAIRSARSAAAPSDDQQ